ncbi:MAG: ATP-binding protein [Dysgonamonadaceae bacterium]|jgi:predicted AAA+ superfamily ATPase|nr:ATP-binding protein [Dysgonamonadaceae bacterium]
MINREIEKIFLHLLQKYPAVNITGPRQSGKTTLVKSMGEGYRYFSLEDPETRLFAEEDPRGFLRSAGDRFILDEVQHIPALFSYLQGILDGDNRTGKVILLGSQSFLMNEQIAQTLAGRIANLKLLPFSMSELSTLHTNEMNINACLFRGGYPRLHNENIDPVHFFPYYIETYLQRDVRQLKNIGNLNVFTRFVKLCAGRTGNVVNLSALANDADISLNTAKSWLSLLEASYILFFVQPYSGNVNRRLVKSPKLYFYDTGLVCSLLNIEQEHQLDNFYLRGNLFENFIFTELIKNRYNRGLPANLYFLRDTKGAEIDCVMEKADKLRLIEIKSSATLSSSHFKNMESMRKLFPLTEDYLIYTGTDEPQYNNVKCFNYKHITELLES